MKQPASVLKDVERIRQAICCARAFAEDRGVSMTVERLAVCLGVSSRYILEIAMQEESGYEYQDAKKLLRMACEEIAASHIEHGMTKGNNPSMDIFMLKNNLNYRDKTESAIKNTAVVFFGEESMMD